jgi:hypothetical protein
MIIIELFDVGQSEVRKENSELVKAAFWMFICAPCNIL